jgi:hypothetical protein
MAYISQLTEEVVENILENSAIPPVIVIQGDHGSGMLLNWDSAENSCLLERTSILNAYYIPSDEETQLYETITPVNSFRVVLNEIFDFDLPLLDDKSYFSSWDKPYQVEEITNRIEESCDLEK